MVLAEVGCALIGFILCISGIPGPATSICAVNAEHLHHHSNTISSIKGYTVGGNEHSKNSSDGNRVSYNKSEESHLNNTIKNMKKGDAKLHCCRNVKRCQNGIQLSDSDLQVKVIPSTEGQTVTLMCSTSCALTEKSAAYIWYKNGEFLYEDWSPWYQQLVSSETSVTYSCAIKGYKAPEVSVDSITPTCFTVTYAKGRMCSFKQTSEEKSCTITYPTEVRVLKTQGKLSCNTSCAQADHKLALNVHQNQREVNASPSSNESSSCDVKDFEDLHYNEVCAVGKNCWSINYVRRIICALEGSSVNISSYYSHPHNKKPKSKSWYKIKRSEEEEVVEVSGRVNYSDHANLHILRISNLERNDSAEYTFKLQKSNGSFRDSHFRRVTLVVTGLKVTLAPSAVVTEGQRVTLSCSTSCPLPDNTNYTWYFNGRPLMSPQSQNKHLVLDPVSSQHAGNYSCAVKAHNNITSTEQTLTVDSKTGKLTAAAAGVCAAVFLVLILLAVYLWLRRKRTSGQALHTEAMDNTEQLNLGPVYENVQAQPEKADELHYSRVRFSKTKTDALYSTVQPHPPRKHEDVAYAVVNFRRNTTPE